MDIRTRLGLEATRANARMQRKLGDAGVYSFLLDPASRSGITRRLQSASQGSRPTRYRNGFCLLLPGDRAWLLTYEQARQRAAALLRNPGVHAGSVGPISRSDGSWDSGVSWVGMQGGPDRVGFCVQVGPVAFMANWSELAERVAADIQKRPKLRYYCSRWPVADALNKLPWTCWSSLVDWALGRDDDGRWGWRGLRAVALPAVSSYNPRSVCYRDAQATGACYCGKVRTRAEEEAARREESWLQPGGVVVED